MRLHLSNGILTLQCVMATVNLKNWMMQRANQRLHLTALTARFSPHTPPWNQPPLSVFVSLSWWHSCCCWQTLSCVWSCAQCHPPLPPSFCRIIQSGADCADTVAVTLCHTVSSVGVSVASVASVSQDTGKRLCWLHLFVWQSAWLLECVVVKRSCQQD